MTLLAVCQKQTGSAERAHVSVNLAVELADLARRRSTLLLDLDPMAEATRQALRELPAKHDTLRTVLMQGRPVDEAARRLRLNIRGWSYFFPVYLHVVPGARDLAGDAREEASLKLVGALRLLRARFKQVVCDVPSLSDSLGRAAAAAADIVLVPLTPGPDAEKEVESVVDEAAAAGVKASALRFFLVATDSNPHFASLARESLGRYYENARRGQLDRGRLLSVEVGHSPRIFGSSRLESKRRSDWTALAIALLADMAGT